MGARPTTTVCTRRRIAAVVCVSCLAAPLAGACDRPTAPTTTALPRAPSSKIDPAVRRDGPPGSTQQVIVLGNTQLLAPLGGLDDFANRHANADRLALRREVVAELQAIAAREQPQILAAIGRTAPLRALWIVNAIVVRVTPSELETLERLPQVRYVYPSSETVATASSGGVGLVLPHIDDQPFAVNGRRVAWNVERLGAPRVWQELGVVGAGVTVAVLDGGAEYGHTDLRARTWRNARETPNNGADDDRNGYVDDVHGFDLARMTPEVRASGGVFQHGTVVSGIVAGDGSGGTITGVAPGARVMQLIGNGPTAAALAYQYAIEQNADVLNMSFSLPDLGNLRGFWRMMSDHAVAAGLVLVGGAGNFRQTRAPPVQHLAPKDVPSVISVGGVDAENRLAPFSSGGPVEWGSVALYGDHALPAGLIKPDVVAFPGPGYPVLGATADGYLEHSSVQGNSFSGPQGAGVAALMLSAEPRLPAWRVRTILEETAIDLGRAGKDNDFGAGLIDALAAVRRAQSNRGLAAMSVRRAQ